MILLLVAACNTPGYPTTPAPTDYAMLFSITEKGAERFIQKAVGEVMAYARQLDIPDIHLDLNLGITALHLDLSDLKIMELDINGVSAMLLEGQDITVHVEAIDVELAFEWYFVQSSYPFIEDRGAGTLLVSGAQLSTQLDSRINKDCNGHVLMDIEFIDLALGKLGIQLAGGSSWLYQSFIDLILDAMSEKVSKVLSDLIIQATDVYFTEYMENSAYYLPIVTQTEVIKDDRFIDKFIINDKLLTIVYSGYTYKFDTLKDQYIASDMLNTVALGKFNNELVFAIHAAGFDNVFYIFHKYYQSYSGEGFKATEPPTLVIENVANRIVYNFEFDEVQYNANLLCHLNIESQEVVDPSNNMTIDVGILTQDCACASIQPSNTEVCHNAAAFFTKANKETPYQINNTPFMDITLFTIVNDAEERVIRLVGGVP